MAKNYDNNKINYRLVEEVKKFLPETIGEKDGISVKDFFHEVNGKKEVYFSLVEKKLEKIIFKAIEKYVESNGDGITKEEIIGDNPVIYELAKVARMRMVVA